MAKEYIIWSDEDLKIEDWRDDLLEQEPGLCEGDLFDRMVELNSLYLDDERANLHRSVIETPILLVAQLGLWYGTRSASRIIPSGRVSDCLYSREDGPKAWYVDEKGELRARIHHHDGCNRYWYRGIRPDVSEAAIERLCSLISDQREYGPLLRRLTYRLGDIVGDVYGWTFPRRPKASLRGVA